MKNEIQIIVKRKNLVLRLILLIALCFLYNFSLRQLTIMEILIFSFIFELLFIVVNVTQQYLIQEMTKLLIKEQNFNTELMKNQIIKDLQQKVVSNN
ncbi:MAG: hypothetical protein QXG00_04100 [Candidatus Woesearchaeota archaeon]